MRTWILSNSRSDALEFRVDATFSADSPGRSEFEVDRSSPHWSPDHPREDENEADG